MRLATAGARAMAWLGPHNPLGISPDVARQLDTGPSVFVTAVLMYLTVVHRAPIVASLTALVIIGEVAITPNLAGREHLIGMVTAAILALTARLAHPRPLHPSAAPCGKAQLPAHPRALRRRATATAHLDTPFIRTPRGRRKDVNVRLPVRVAALEHTNSSSTLRWRLHPMPVG